MNEYSVYTSIHRVSHYITPCKTRASHHTHCVAVHITCIPCTCPGFGTAEKRASRGTHCVTIHTFVSTHETGWETRGSNWPGLPVQVVHLLNKQVWRAWQMCPLADWPVPRETDTGPDTLSPLAELGVHYMNNLGVCLTDGPVYR